MSEVDYYSDQLLVLNIQEICSELQFKEKDTPGVFLTREAIGRFNIGSRIVNTSAHFTRTEEEVTLALADEALRWINSHAIGDEIKKRLLRRLEKGVRTIPDLLRAYQKALGVESLPPTFEKHTPLFGHEEQTRLTKEIWDDEKKREVFLKTLEGSTPTKTSWCRGEEIDNYFKRHLNKRGATIVDVGCSSGEITRRLARKLPKTRLIGVDKEFPSVGGMNNKEGVKFIQGDAFSLPLEDKSVDAIISFNTFRHFTEEGKLRAIKEFARVVRDKGVIILGPLDNQSTMETGIKIFRKIGNQLKMTRFISSLVEYAI